MAMLMIIPKMQNTVCYGRCPSKPWIDEFGNFDFETNYTIKEGLVVISEPVFTNDSSDKKVIETIGEGKSRVVPFKEIVGKTLSEVEEEYGCLGINAVIEIGVTEEEYQNHCAKLETIKLGGNMKGMVDFSYLGSDVILTEERLDFATVPRIEPCLKKIKNSKRTSRRTLSDWII